MLSDNLRITISGQRIKKEAKSRKITQEELANILGYAGRNEISACYNGKRFLSHECYETLSKLWDIRIEYLLGIDDYRTLNDFLDSTNSKARHIQEMTHYFLKAHGYLIEETDYLYSNEHYYKETDNYLLDKYNEWSFDNVLEVTNNLGEKYYITEKDLNDLIVDFFMLFERRLAPCDAVKEYWEKEL